MDLFADIHRALLAQIAQLAETGMLPADLVLDKITVEPPGDPGHGELSTNAALILAGQTDRPARDIAQSLGAGLVAEAVVAQAEVAGPGFLNLTLPPAAWDRVIDAALADPAAFGRLEAPAQKINVEFVSANPSARLQVSHARGAVFGDALARLLTFQGHAVTREYYINDAGPQGDVLARSVYLRYLKVQGHAVDNAHAAAEDSDLDRLAETLAAQVGEALLDLPESAWLEQVRAFCTDQMMQVIRADLAALGITMDSYFSESTLMSSGRIEAALTKLEALGLIYDGVLEPAGGTPPPDWSPREQTLFRSTAHGDDQDRPVRKSDGSWAYFAPDIAYHYDKLQRGFNALVDVMGVDHGGYVKRLKAVVAALSGGQVPLDVKLLHLTRRVEEDAPTDLQALVQAAGAGHLRLTLLARRNDAPAALDPEAMRAQVRENPAFWIQFAHVHALRLSQTAPPGDVSALDQSDARALMRKVAAWPAVLARAGRLREPNRMALYLMDLADVFQTWRQGSCATLNGQEAAKSALAGAVAIVIATGLGILGVKPAEEML
ncbi:MAG: arginine--tRNA ligase [Pseudomonadota bacterium]